MNQKEFKRQYDWACPNAQILASADYGAWGPAISGSAEHSLKLPLGRYSSVLGLYWNPEGLPTVKTETEQKDRLKRTTTRKQLNNIGLLAMRFAAATQRQERARVQIVDKNLVGQKKELYQSSHSVQRVDGVAVGIQPGRVYRFNFHG